MSLGKVLLVEDRYDNQIIVQATLKGLCDITVAADFSQGYEALKTNTYDLIILDVVLPDGDGFDLCRKVRTEEANKNTPIIFLTGEGDVGQRVMGFDLGADDYVVKPLEPNEFKARVLSKLKRKGSDQLGSFISGIFVIDGPSQKASLKKDEFVQELNLTPIEFKLLVQFLRNEGKIFSREELLKSVWGNSVHVSGHTVDTHISSLRKKVGEYGQCFKAIIKKGYCYNSQKKIARFSA